MKNQPRRRSMEIAPVPDISRRARRERSETVSRLLQSIVSNRAADKGPMRVGDTAKAQACSC